MGLTGALAVTAALSAYQVYQSEVSRKDAKKERKKQEAEQGRLENELKERELNEQALETGRNLRARNQSGGYLRRGGTLLTSPLGAPSQPSTGSMKTVLGG